VRVDGQPFAANAQPTCLRAHPLPGLRSRRALVRDVVDAEQRPQVFTGTGRLTASHGNDGTGWTEGDCGLGLAIRPADTGSPAGRHRSLDHRQPGR
jgi:hypothetical protein